MKNQHTPLLSSRRQFLATTGAALAATALPTGRAFGQAPAKYTRLNLTTSQAPIASYAKAISAMLALPPSDARNWYRNAFIHLLDCPHGNWWFLPWHRGYLGWFEQTCRDLSGDPYFALPYWDWTANTCIPQSFLQGVLTPANNAFIPSLQIFQQQLENPVSDLWKSFSPAQLQQLSVRENFTTFQNFWNAAVQSFFPIAQARTGPECFDARTLKAVSLATVQSALDATDFVSFGSPIASQHSGFSGYAILEGQPHNNVHGFIGGFMGEFLSPIDPIFFMHHSNLDRLWDVWTRKQQTLGLPTLPTDPTELANWKKEPFLFFTDSKGQPVTQNTAGDYATIGAFDYNYQAGSGDKAPTKPSPMAKKMWAADLMPKAANLRHAARAEVMLPGEVNAAASQPEGPALFAKVTLKPGVDTNGVQFDVLVNPPAEASQVNFDDPSFAGSFSVFGTRRGGAHADQPLSFTVSISEAVAKLKAAKRMDPESKLNVQVVASRKGVALAPVDLNVADISVGTI